MHNTSDTIKQLRALGNSQAEIARAAGITQCTVSRWGAGQGTASADAGIRLARILDSKLAGLQAARKTRRAK